MFALIGAPMPSAHARLHLGTLAQRDGDLLAALDTLDRALHRLMGRITTYREALTPQRLRLRHGEDPAQVRAALDRWGPTLREIRRVAREV